jgi:NTP pyrophosphatase (non-canonical NTP hydrolase)
MELNEYQKKAMSTCMETSNNFSYMLLNLVAEVGEFSGKIAKQIRKGQSNINQNQLQTEMRVLIEHPELKEETCKELGDVLWQLSGLCTVMNVSLEDIAKQNLNKLADRQKRNVIDGNGDNR